MCRFFVRAILPAIEGHPMRTLALVLAVPFYATTLLAQDRPTLDDIRSLRCTFESRVVTPSWEPGSEPELDVGKDSEPLQFFIDAIDRENQKARMIGNAGSADVIVIPSFGVLDIIERPPRGGLYLLTIIEGQLSDSGLSSSLPAAYSRHGILFGRFIVSQYYGSCQPWE